MFEGRFSKLLQKLAFWGSSPKYELLAKGELETLVSPGARARGVRPDPHPVRAARAALPKLARRLLVLERRRFLNHAGSHFCSGPSVRLLSFLTLPCQPIVQVRD